MTIDIAKLFDESENNIDLEKKDIMFKETLYKSIEKLDKFHEAFKTSKALYENPYLGQVFNESKHQKISLQAAFDCISFNDMRELYHFVEELKSIYRKYYFDDAVSSMKPKQETAFEELKNLETDCVQNPQDTNFTNGI